MKNSELQRVKDLISKDDFEQAFEELRLILNNSNLNDELIHQSGRYHDLEKQIHKGTIDSEKVGIAKNQIRIALLELIKKSDNNDISVIKRQKKEFPKSLILKDFFTHTEKLIYAKLWRVDRKVSEGELEKIWVPLSAAISDRMERGYLSKKIGSYKTLRINNLNRFLKKGNRKSNIPYAITGPPGSGKTFELIKLYFDYRKSIDKGKTLIPFIIFINELPPDIFATSNETSTHKFRTFVLTYLKRTEYSDRVVEFFEENFYDFDYIFLIDAFDEIPNKEDYELAVKMISEDFIREIKSSNWKFILTCRTEDYDRKFDFIEIEIQPLSIEQIENFYKKRHGKISSEEEKRRKRSWEQLKSGQMAWFHPYLSNPYFLVIMLDSIKNAIQNGKNMPLDLKSLFNDTISRELNKFKKRSKDENGTRELDFINIFNTFIGFVSYSLIEKTSAKQEAFYDLSQEKDVKNFFRFATKNRNFIQPFSSTFKYIHEIYEENITPGEVAKVSSKLSRYIEQDKLDVIFEIIGIIKSNGFEQFNFLEFQIDNRLLENRYILQEAKDLLKQCTSSLEKEKVYLITTFLIFLYVVENGLDKKLLRTQSKHQYRIIGFRHRRIMEFLAAHHLNESMLMFKNKSLNLWYKQTLSILAAITNDIDWFFNQFDTENKNELFLITDTCKFMHPNKVRQDDIQELAEKLFNVFINSNSITAHKSLKGIFNLIYSRHWIPREEIIVKIINAGNDPSLYPICFKTVVELDRLDVLTRKLKFNFIKNSFRNLISMDV